MHKGAGVKPAADVEDGEKQVETHPKPAATVESPPQSESVSKNPTQNLPYLIAEQSEAHSALALARTPGVQW